MQRALVKLWSHQARLGGGTSYPGSGRHSLQFAVGSTVALRCLQALLCGSPSPSPSQGPRSLMGHSLASVATASSSSRGSRGSTGRREHRKTGEPPAIEHHRRDIKAPRPRASRGRGAGQATAHNSQRGSSPAHLTASQINQALVRAKGDTPALLSIIEQHAYRLNPVNVATALNCLTHSPLPKDGTGRQGQQDVAVPTRDRVRAAVGLLEARMACTKTYGPQAVSNSLHALATMRLGSPTTFEALCQQARSCLPDMTAQHLANISWACATAGHVDAPLFQAMAKAAVEKISLKELSTPQHLATLAWAFAASQHPCPDLFQALERASAPRLKAFNEQGLAMILAAFAKAGYKAPLLFQAAALEVPARAGRLSPQGLSNALWAFAKAGHPENEVFATVGAEAARRLQRSSNAHFGHRELGGLAWAFATARLAPPPGLIQAIDARVALDHRETIPPSGSTSTSSSPGPRAVWPSGSPVSPKSIASLGWGFATLGVPAEAAQGILQRLLSFPQHIGRRGRVQEESLRAPLMVLFALAVYGRLDAALLSELSSPLIPRRSELTGEGLCTLFQCCVAAHLLEEERRSVTVPARELSDLLPQELFCHARSAWVEAAKHSVKSRLQASIHAAMTRMGLRYDAGLRPLPQAITP